jgi:endonuclease YncB( thermonuclease family)
VGHEVKITFDTPIKDVHGRYLAYVERDAVDVNRRMVEEGVAMVYTEYPVARESKYLSAEGLARKSRRGIWGGPRARTRIEALRRDWAHSRGERLHKVFNDPLRDD